MKIIGVTGGRGFIGTYVCEELERRGYKVIIFDHQNDTDREVFLGDIRDKTAVTEFVAHADGVIHLAACLGTQETIQNPYPACETNLLGSINLLQAVAQYNVPMTYIAVGNHWMNNPYSITKSTVERFVKMYNKERGTKINIVRAMNAYGPRQLAAAPYGSGKVRKITPSFCCKALSGEPIEVYGDGNQISDMVYAGDVAKALVNALEKAMNGVVFSKPVEIGPEESKTVNEVAELIRDLSDEYTDDSVEIIHLPMRPGEIVGATVKADTSTLDLVDMKPYELVPLEEGMRRTVKYFYESKGKVWN